jgi:hypothetical protein
VRACACGCGIFGVGSTFLLPDEDMTCMVYFQYDYLDQNQNWSGAMPAPAANNSDKDIRTRFYNIGAMYMINQDWGVMANIPYWDRNFTTTIDAAGDIGAFDHGALGDIKLMGFYTGLSADRSTGIIAGIKLPSGDHTYENFDPDTEIGTGSTDIILGAYRVGKFAAERWQWFIDGTWECPFATTQGYRPGDEIDAAAGIFYNTGRIGPIKKVSPVLQLLFSDRAADEGINADPLNTGYYRLLVSPGVEVDMDHLKFYADTEFPVLQYYNGNQLSAPVALKVIFAYAY